MSQSDDFDPETGIRDISQHLNDIVEDIRESINIDVINDHLPERDIELSQQERCFLLNVERGNAASVKEMVGQAGANGLNLNCVDPLGRNALLIAIENEHMEILEILLATPGAELGDSLLHAINEENVIAVELLLNTQSDRQNKKNLMKLFAGGDNSKRGAIFSPSLLFLQIREEEFESEGLLGSAPSSSFTPDITPIILAAHRDNYEIIKILLNRGDRVLKPHDLRCPCNDCALARKKDSLRHSKSRINAYRALASPSLIALSSRDPILTAFELSWELKILVRLENEFKLEYEQLSDQCQEFARGLLEQTRGSEELAVILNHEVGSTPSSLSANKIDDDDYSDRMKLSRLKLAIKYKQKKFVAHPHCQQLLASLWYEGMPGFRRMPFLQKMGIISAFACIFPFLSIIYIFAPKSKFSRIIRKPFIKFLCHTSSYVVFLGLLILAALKIEFLSIGSSIDQRMNSQGPIPSITEWFILCYIIGFLWQEFKELWCTGVRNYFGNRMNLLDFMTNSLYVATIALRLVAYVRYSDMNSDDPNETTIKRSHWHSFHPVLISESVFATANILSTLRLVSLFTVSPQLGPLQISIGRILNDIVKFLCMYLLLLVAFAFGLNQLYWFYSNERTKNCKGVEFALMASGPDVEKYNYCVGRGRFFSNLFEISQSLYWTTYGLVDLTNLNLEYPHVFTEFVGKFMFGAYSCIALIVLLNMLIAMMNNSYQIIAERADFEWKFARSSLWVSYFEEGATLPVPFNVVPSPKSVYYIIKWIKDHICSRSENRKETKFRSIRKLVRKVNEIETKYQVVMRDLIKRYLMDKQRSDDKQGVTEDDLNEIKGDISSFRFELLEILRNNGMSSQMNEKTVATKVRRKGSKRSLNRFGAFLNSSISEEKAEANSQREKLTSFGSSEAKSFESQDSFNSGAAGKTNEVFISDDVQVPPGKHSEVVLDPSTLPFNQYTGLVKRAVFNWQQEVSESKENPDINTYVYDGRPTVSKMSKLVTRIMEEEGEEEEEDKLEAPKDEKIESGDDDKQCDNL